MAVKIWTQMWFFFGGAGCSPALTLQNQQTVFKRVQMSTQIQTEF
jgi:hypothetical protein